MWSIRPTCHNNMLNSIQIDWEFCDKTLVSYGQGSGLNVMETAPNCVVYLCLPKHPVWKKSTNKRLSEHLIKLICLKSDHMSYLFIITPKCTNSKRNLIQFNCVLCFLVVFWPCMKVKCINTGIKVQTSGITTIHVRFPLVSILTLRFCCCRCCLLFVLFVFVFVFAVIVVLVVVVVVVDAANPFSARE